MNITHGLILFVPVLLAAGRWPEGAEGGDRAQTQS